MTRRQTNARYAAILTAITVATAPCISPAAEPIPIFDTHVHYSEPAWQLFAPHAALELMSKLRVVRVLVSSTPDDGTLTLHRTAPDRVVPFLRPYRAGVGTSDWYEHPEIIPYLKERLARGVHRGIGEFHLFDESAVATPVLKEVMALAVGRDVPVQVHSGAGPVRALFAAEPRLKVFWAHAGMSESPAVVGELLDRHAQLWTEVSFLAGDIAPGGRLSDEWRALLVRHIDRFMIGTDTYVTGRWETYTGLIEEHRRWLGQLPPDIAEAIAFRNAVRLFGDGGVPALRN